MQVYSSPKPTMPSEKTPKEPPKGSLKTSRFLKIWALKIIIPAWLDPGLIGTRYNTVPQCIHHWHPQWTPKDPKGPQRSQRTPQRTPQQTSRSWKIIIPPWLDPWLIGTRYNTVPQCIHHWHPQWTPKDPKGPQRTPKKPKDPPKNPSTNLQVLKNNHTSLTGSMANWDKA